MTRIFKKPTLKGKGESNLSTGEKDSSLPSRFLKKLEPEKESPRTAYLRALEQKIYDKEKELESIVVSADALRQEVNASIAKDTLQRETELATLDNELALKRAERKQLEAPLTERSKALDGRELKLTERSNWLDTETQRVFEREREIETKLEGVKDLADQLAETRTRLSIREKLLDGRELSLKDREMKYLVRVSETDERYALKQKELQERENIVSLRELNVTSKEENLSKREEKLLDEKLLVQSQRQALLAAKNDRNY